MAPSMLPTAAAAVLLLLSSLLCCSMLLDIDVVDAMVANPTRMTTTTTTTSNSNSNSNSNNINSNEDSDAFIRMLIEDQGKDRRRMKASESYSIDMKKAQPTTATTTTAAAAATSNSNHQQQNQQQHHQRTSPLLDEWRDYEALRETNLEDSALRPFFFESGFERQQVIANRFVQVLTTLYKARDEWTTSSQKFVEIDDVSLKAPDQDDPAAVRLCESVASLGPLAVKLGQTLSQRPDIVGKPACDALKRLQTQNVPFDDALAYAILRESLDYWDGPLAGNLVDVDVVDDNDNDNDGTATQVKVVKPLFKSLSKEPIASASLGQVYKATTWDDVDIALKIQRPDALSVIAIDSQCFRIAFAARKNILDWTEQWKAFTDTSENKKKNNNNKNVKHSPETGMTEDEVRSRGEEGTVASVIDRVAMDIKREMDYRVEADNSYKFRDSLEFLGFVDTPDVLLATDKILMTQFVDGHHLSSLNDTSKELALTRMAVEACTASMVLTGFVHADPHEGNLMLRNDDGRIVFLDFGLMSDVSQNVMEAFAQGIQALLSEDFVSMTEAFSNSGFVTTPIMHRDSPDDLWKVDPEYGLVELSVELETAMKTTSGGMSRFGALATVLNKKISPNWLVFTPPYVLLLIRTFLTLEGIAAQVDPDFNIYEMSLPWVVRRSLSPSTEKGTQVLRSTILKPDNKIQWERVMELMELQKATNDELLEDVAVVAVAAAESGESVTAAASSSSSSSTTSDAAAAAAPAPASSVAAATTAEEKEQKQQEYAAAQQGAMKDAVGTLLGSTSGKALRGVLKDLDTPDLIWKLGSKEGRPIVKMGTEKVLSKLFSSKRRRRRSSSSSSSSSSKNNNNKAADNDSSNIIVEEENYRPMSQECKTLRDQQARRTKVVTKFLIKSQIRRCLFSIKGIAGIARLALSTMQITMSIILRKTILKLKLGGFLFGSSSSSKKAAVTV